MDVRCERCKAEYTLEESRITESGVSVKCSRCGNVFIVRKKVVVVTEPLPAPDEGRAAPQPPMATGAAADERAQQWRVRQANGNQITFRELTTLQRWIVERKLSRDDELGLDGGSWKQLGSIQELSSFFQLVDEAQRAVLLERSSHEPAFATAPKETTSQPLPPKEAPPVVARNEPLNGSNGPGSSAPRDPRASAQFEDFSFPKASDGGPAPRFETAGLKGLQPGAAEPAFAQERPSIGSRSDSGVAIAASLKGRPNRALSIILLLAFLGAVSYLAYRYFVWVPQGQRQEQLEASKRSSAPPAPRSEAASPPEVSAPTPAVKSTPVKAEEAKPPQLSAEAAPGKSAETAAAVGDSPQSKQAAPPAPGEVPAATGAAGATGDRSALPSAAQAVGPAKQEEAASFDGYMDKADRLREREQPRAALQAYQKAQELEPARPEPLAGRGLALLDLGRTAQAIAAFEQALEIDPRHGIALMGLAEAYRAEGKKEEAVRYYEKYLAVVPDGPEAQVARAAIKALQE